MMYKLLLNGPYKIIKYLFLATAFYIIMPLSFIHASDPIQIVGSSTVFPFSTAVAEEFGALTPFATPTIESTGTGGGIKLFCAGVGQQHPDIVNASRPIKPSELALCQKNGVTEISEVIIGYDGIVIANVNTESPLDLTLPDLFLALAKKIPSQTNDQELIDNPYIYWDEVNAELPHKKIEILGPPPTSGTRDAFVELVMHQACEMFEIYKHMTKEDKKTHCSLVRDDGAFIDAGENDNLIIQKIIANPDAFGIFGFSFLDRNMDQIQGNNINGIEPTFENIASGSYPISRALYFYVKRQHIPLVPGMKEFIAEFFRDKAIGEGGYLEERGLIPLPEDQKNENYQKAQKEGII